MGNSSTTVGGLSFSGRTSKAAAERLQHKSDNVRQYFFIPKFIMLGSPFYPKSGFGSSAGCSVCRLSIDFCTHSFMGDFFLRVAPTLVNNCGTVKKQPPEGGCLCYINLCLFSVAGSFLIFFCSVLRWILVNTLATLSLNFE